MPTKSRRGSKTVSVEIPNSISPGVVSFWQTMKTLMSNRMFIITLALVTIPVGIASQLSWLQFRCIGEPFIGSVKATCRDNPVRMIFGGPAITLAALILTTWIKRQKHPVSKSSLLIPFYFLLPTLALPFIMNEQRHDQVIQAIKIAFSLSFLFVARHKIWETIGKLFAKPAFSLDCRLSNGELTITAAGEMFPEERNWIFERTLIVIGSYGTDFDRVCIDCRGLKNISEEYSEILKILLAYARFAGKSIETLGNAELFE